MLYINLMCLAFHVGRLCVNFFCVQHKFLSVKAKRRKIYFRPFSTEFSHILRMFFPNHTVFPLYLTLIKIRTLIPVYYGFFFSIGVRCVFGLVFVCKFFFVSCDFCSSADFAFFYTFHTLLQQRMPQPMNSLDKFYTILYFNSISIWLWIILVYLNLVTRSFQLTYNIYTLSSFYLYATILHHTQFSIYNIQCIYVFPIWCLPCANAFVALLLGSFFSFYYRDLVSISL